LHDRKTLGYQLKDDGMFVLYSVGEDGHDDGGDPQSAPAGKFDLWEGKDAAGRWQRVRRVTGALEH